MKIMVRDNKTGQVHELLRYRKDQPDVFLKDGKRPLIIPKHRITVVETVHKKKNYESR